MTATLHQFKIALRRIQLPDRNRATYCNNKSTEECKEKDGDRNEYKESNLEKLNFEE